MLRCEHLSNLASAAFRISIAGAADPGRRARADRTRKYGRGFAAVAADQIKDRKAVLVANDRLTVD